MIPYDSSTDIYYILHWHISYLLGLIPRALIKGETLETNYRKTKERIEVIIHENIYISIY